MLAYSQGDTSFFHRSYIIAASPTPVYECRDKQNLQGFKYKCEPPDILAKFFANQQSSAVFPAYTPESTKRSRRPPSAQSFPIEDKKQDKL